jgi:hypothetical protein
MFDPNQRSPRRSIIRVARVIAARAVPIWMLS